MPPQEYQVLLVSQNELPAGLLARPVGERRARAFAVTRATDPDEAIARLQNGAPPPSAMNAPANLAACDGAVTTEIRGVPHGPRYGPGPVAETFPEPHSRLGRQHQMRAARTRRDRSVGAGLHDANDR